MSTAAQLINQTSGRVEYYTPIPIVEAARELMGGIDLDPASSHTANVRIRASSIYTEADNGLSQPWYGRVWMNHPFGRAEKACTIDCNKDHEHHSIDYYGNAAWINYLENEFLSGDVIEACCITFACTSEAWFKPLLLRPQCFLIPRTNYLLPDGSVLKGVTKGSVVTYFGPKLSSFVSLFDKFGVVKVKL